MTSRTASELLRDWRALRSRWTFPTSSKRLVRVKTALLTIFLQVCRIKSDYTQQIFCPTKFGPPQNPMRAHHSPCAALECGIIHGSGALYVTYYGKNALYDFNGDGRFYLC